MARSAGEEGNMTIQTRLRRLERSYLAQKPQSRSNWLNEQEWLTAFEAWGQQGHFDGERYYSIALAPYRDELKKATVQSDPPFDPADFMPKLVDSPESRISSWRN